MKNDMIMGYILFKVEKIKHVYVISLKSNSEMDITKSRRLLNIRESKKKKEKHNYPEVESLCSN